MPTEAELKQEPEWRSQFVPPNLADLGRKLEAFYQPGIANIGIYGDHRHLKGYHRSRAWILASRFCTNRFYSVHETPGNTSGGNYDWISGIDIVVGYALSKAIYDRLNLARSKGKLRHVLQVLLERDPWHVHISIDREHADDNHDELYSIITGAPGAGENEVSLQVSLPLLREGIDSADVRTAQGLLCARGFATDIDGEFGPDTRSKTEAMQKHYGAEIVDGIWGPETWTIAITAEDLR